MLGAAPLSSLPLSALPAAPLFVSDNVVTVAARTRTIAVESRRRVVVVAAKTRTVTVERS